MSNNPLISTVIPVYNAEDYIEDTIRSVIKQDIGFERNIEIIIIDDGSVDASADICKRYVKQYPDNIRYFWQENAGVSAARNAGLGHVRGDYVHLIDSDDIISINLYSLATKALTENENVDIAAPRLEFFEGRLGNHPLNYKFSGKDRVIDLSAEPNNPLLHMSSCVIRSKAINHKFDASIKISEDMKFLTEILKEAPRYALIGRATYYYRKRKAGSSAIDGSLLSRDYYLVTPVKVYEYLMDMWQLDDGRPHPYVQYTIAYDLQWRIGQQSQTVLNEEEQSWYKAFIYSLIRRIDDEVFYKQRVLTLSQLIFILKLKHGDLTGEHEKRIEELVRSTRTPVRIDFVERREGNVTRIEGWLPAGTDLHKVNVKLNDKPYSVQMTENVHRHQVFLGDLVYAGNHFSVDIPSDARGVLGFYDKTGKRVGVVTKRQSGIPDVRYGYRLVGDSIYVNDNECIKIFEYKWWRVVAYEARWMVRILISLRLRESASKIRAITRSTLKSKISLEERVQLLFMPVAALLRNLRHISYRAGYFALLPILRRHPVWIVSDRVVAAGDNGEALFEYMHRHTNGNEKVYFAIDKSSDDYSRLRDKYGKKIINSSGLWYRMLFLHSSKIISSHADDIVINPFADSVEHLYDLFKFDFVFLQHGVIRNDISRWLNRYNKNIRLFVVSAEQEYQSILDYKYYYPTDRILLSGLPRYDLLENDPKSKLILAPTWRHNLAAKAELVNGHRQYNPEFKQSDYFKFYNKLINDQNLHKALAKHGMTAELYLHPSFEAQAGDFSQNDYFVIKEFPYDYRTAFREGMLLVSDYSSVIFDFIYLMKPVIYAQFDQDSFYKSHIYTRGYMDDERDGFGPVAKTYEQTIAAIIEMLDSGCVMEGEYRIRAEKFFKWHDRSNSQRVYDAIKSLQES